MRSLTARCPAKLCLIVHYSVRKVATQFRDSFTITRFFAPNSDVLVREIRQSKFCLSTDGAAYEIRCKFSEKLASVAVPILTRNVPSTSSLPLVAQTDARADTPGWLFLSSLRTCISCPNPRPPPLDPPPVKSVIARLTRFTDSRSGNSIDIVSTGNQLTLSTHVARVGRACRPTLNIVHGPSLRALAAANNFFF